MPATKTSAVVKIAIEKEGQLPLLTTFDQVRINGPGQVSSFGMSVFIEAGKRYFCVSIFILFFTESAVG